MTAPIVMFTPPSDMDPVERAMTYPYAIPDSSYLFRNGAWTAADIGVSETAGRVPVIACGSNRSPAQLARKYADFDEVTIPVQRVWLHDFDVVYAAHITGYGSVSANLLPSPGVRVELSITWLDDNLMDRMHATEGLGYSYDYAELSGLRLETEGGPAPDRAFGYIHRGGALRVNGGPVGLQEIAAQGRPYPSWPQPQAIAEAQRRLKHDGSVASFIHDMTADRAHRLTQEKLLQTDSVAFEYEHCRVVS